MPEALFANRMQDLPAWDAESTEVETIDFLLALLLYFRPAVIVEAGTYRGHFAVPAARVAAHWGGCVWTWDPMYYKWLEGLKSCPRNLVYIQDDFVLDGLPQPDFCFIDSGRARHINPDGTTASAFVHPLSHDIGIRERHVAEARQYHVLNTVIAIHDMNTAADWRGGIEIASHCFRFMVGRGLGLLTQ